jgi:predicted RNA binding protein YcfA (HicA-like mRNA interferase family)
MTQLPILSGREIIKVLSKLGYKPIRQKGSHIRLSAPSRKPITIPDYKSIDRSLLIKILRDAELKPDDFIKLI